VSDPLITSPPPQSPVWALYDLSLPERAERLAKDEGELRAQSGVIMVAGRHAAQADAFLDGAEMEQLWLKHDRWRASLEALRTELASSVDGEVFLRAARRAVWLAARAQEGAAPRLIFGAGMAESLAAWLAGKLIGVPCAVSLQDDTRWTSKLVSQLRAEARAVRESSLTQCLNA